MFFFLCKYLSYVILCFFVCFLMNVIDWVVRLWYVMIVGKIGYVKMWIILLYIERVVKFFK